MLHSIINFLADYGLVGILLLSLIDSAGVPLPVGMDAMLVLLAAKHPEQAWWGALLAVAGSLAGNLFLFLAARKSGSYFVEHTPPPGEHSRFRRWFHRYGLMTVFIPAVVPILPLPLKVFVASAGAMRLKLTHFLEVILAARVLRYFGEAYLGVLVGQESEAFLRRNIWTLAGIAVGLTLLCYFLLRLADRRKAK